MGTYQVSVSVKDIDGSRLATKNEVQFAVADAPLTDATQTTSYSVVEGNRTGTQVLAVFSDGNPYAPLNDFTPAVTWGGTLVGKPTVTVEFVSATATTSTWRVKGSATYAEAGTYAISVWSGTLRAAPSSAAGRCSST